MVATLCRKLGGKRTFEILHRYVFCADPGKRQSTTNSCNLAHTLTSTSLLAKLEWSIYLWVMIEWYRNTDWNDEIEEHFFEKLGKARSQRDQYIVLQAHHLVESYPSVALRLIDLYFESRSDDFDDDRARKVASSAHFALGGHVEALDNYLKALDAGNVERVMHVASPIEFAFLAARYRSTKHYAPALEQLSDIAPPSQNEFDLRFRYCSAISVLLSETGRDPLHSLAMARDAMEIPDDVQAHYPDLVWRLRGITRR